jgi:hypothetical protein
MTVLIDTKDIDAIMMPKKSFAWNRLQYNSWNHYWEGTLKEKT